MTSSAEGQAREARTRPLVRLPPIGFWSYSRQDDDLSNGKLSRLRSLLMAEMQQQYGRQPIQLFQDVSAIPHGAAWEQEIRNSLDNSNFFIPIISPNFIQSEWCSAEVRLFLEREAQLFKSYPDLPRRSRIFPILLIDIEYIEPYDEGALQALKKLQWFDFRGFRHKNYEDETVRQAISGFASSIGRLLLLKVRTPLDSDQEREQRPSEDGRTRDEIAAAREREQGDEARRPTVADYAGVAAGARRAEPARAAWAERRRKLGRIAKSLVNGARRRQSLLALGGMMMAGLLTFVLLDRQTDSTAAPPEVTDKQPRTRALPSATRPAVVPAGKGAAVPPVHSWIWGRWGVNGDCKVFRMISADPHGIRIDFPEGSQVETISRATPQGLETNVATYARDGRSIRVREPALSLEYELTPCR